MNEWLLKNKLLNSFFFVVMCSNFFNYHYLFYLSNI